MRASRGNCKTFSLRRELMTALLAASRQDLAATLGLHANAKSVRLGASAFPRLICTLWQSNPPSIYAVHARFLSPALAHNRQAASAALHESISVFDPRSPGQQFPLFAGNAVVPEGALPPEIPPGPGPELEPGPHTHFSQRSGLPHPLGAS